MKSWIYVTAGTIAVICLAGGSKPTAVTTEQRAIQRAEQVQATALASLKRSLRDADSARFDGVRYVSTPAGEAVCGVVNARNGFGGFVGWRPFVVSGEGVEINSAPAFRKYCL